MILDPRRRDRSLWAEFMTHKIVVWVSVCDHANRGNSKDDTTKVYDMPTCKYVTDFSGVTFCVPATTILDVLVGFLDSFVFVIFVCPQLQGIVL